MPQAGQRARPRCEWRGLVPAPRRINKRLSGSWDSVNAGRRRKTRDADIASVESAPPALAPCPTGARGLHGKWRKYLPARPKQTMYVPAGGPTPTPDSAGLSVRRECASAHSRRLIVRGRAPDLPSWRYRHMAASWTDHTKAARQFPRRIRTPKFSHGRPGHGQCGQSRGRRNQERRRQVNLSPLRPRWDRTLAGPLP